MKLRAMYLVVLCALGACAVDSADDPAPETEALAPADTGPAVDDATSSLIGRCSTRSLGLCSNASFGSLCSVSPARWCLPSNELPDGSILCGCQSQSTI